jgi:drug/metabolite transporter (DMT)-like permease
MFSALSPAYKGILLALVGYSAFSVADACAKWLSDFYSIYQIVAFENLLAVVLLLACAPFLGGTRDLLSNRKNWKIHLFRAVLNFGVAVLLTYCYKKFPIANVYTMIFTKPFFAALLAMWFFSEMVSPARWIAIVVGFAGVLLAMQPGTHNFEPFLIIPFAGAGLIALLFVSARMLENPTIFSVGVPPLLGAGLLSIPFTIMHFDMPMVEHLPVFVLIGVAACLGITCVSLAFRVAAAAVVAPFLYVEMIWALLFGWLIFDDRPDAWMLAGAAIIILSGIYLIESERRSRKKAAA